MRVNAFSGLALLTLAACGGDMPPPDELVEVTEAPREIRFTATDFAFEGPESVEAGLVTLVLENEAETWHHLQLIKLPDDMSMEQFQEAMGQIRPGSPPPDWLHEAGGVNPPPPGQLARVTQELEAGEYAVLCFVDMPDMVPHVFKGMIRPLTVTPATSEVAELAATELTLTLTDYAFGFSEPLTAGTHSIRVRNGADQAHEIALFKLLPGKTMDDVMAWENYEGPSPMEPVGGVAAIAPGQAVNMNVTLDSGDYVALCFIPDATDGRMHVAHGMVLPFTVS